MMLKGIRERPKGLAYRDEPVTPAKELDLIELAAGHIPPTGGDRYSITFRTLRRARAAA